MKIGQTISRRALLSHAAAMAAVAATPAWAAEPNPVVVELFTSQGCSSCPPADALLTELRARPGVVALTYHVDYWDYLGWKDTLASAEYSQRQYDYAKARGDMDVYTPQMIVNGTTPNVGSQRTAILAAIDRAQRAPLPVAMTITSRGNEIAVDVAAGKPIAEATVWLMPLMREVTVKVLKGEIAGTEITYHNVVREVLPAGMWSGGERQLLLPKDSVMPAGTTACVALLQTGKAGPILGCASWGEISA